MAGICCPNTALGNLVVPDSVPTKGAVETLPGSLRCYVTGPASATTGVIVAYDIFGFDAGRVKQICDTIAAQGHLVVLPDFYEGDNIEKGKARGEEMPAWIKGQSDPRRLLTLFSDTLLPFLRARGVQRVASMGWCWGAWFVVKAAATGELVAGVAPHPSYSKLCLFSGEKEDDVMAACRCPLLILPAGDDPESNKPGGANGRVLKAQGLECDIVEFPEMKHGFISRGDIGDATVARDVQLALTLSVAFLNKHLCGQAKSSVTEQNVRYFHNGRLSDASIYGGEVKAVNWDETFGPTLVIGGKEVSTQEVLSKKKHVAILFAGAWCPWCRAFDPMLTNTYAKVKATSPDDVELVYLSVDADEAAFQAALAQKQWAAVPFNRVQGNDGSRAIGFIRKKVRDATGKQQGVLAEKFKVASVPTCVVLDGKTGQILYKDFTVEKDPNSSAAGHEWGPNAPPSWLD